MRDRYPDAGSIITGDSWDEDDDEDEDGDDDAKDP